MTNRVLRLLILGGIAALLGCSSESTTVDPPGDDRPKVITWAGTGLAGYDTLLTLTRTETSLYQPIDVEFTPTLGTFIVDWNNHLIRKVLANDQLQTVIGNGLGDGPPEPDTGRDTIEPWPGTECDLNHPTDVIERNDGFLLLVSWHTHKLREWNPATGKEFVIAGRQNGCSGDDGPFEDALMDQPSHAVQTSDGTLYILDQRNQSVRKVSPAGVISAAVGTSTCDPFAPGGFSGDGGDPLLAEISMPTGGAPPPGGGLALDSEERLYISDTLNHRIRRVDFDLNIIETVVGNGTSGFAGDGGDPLLASLNGPMDIEFGPNGKLYIADEHNHRVRVVDFAKNTINTIAGSGVQGYSGDGGAALDASFDRPRGIAFDHDGNLYIADTWNHRIRRVDL